MISAAATDDVVHIQIVLRCPHSISYVAGVAESHQRVHFSSLPNTWWSGRPVQNKFHMHWTVISKPCVYCYSWLISHVSSGGEMHFLITFSQQANHRCVHLTWNWSGKVQIGVCPAHHGKRLHDTVRVLIVTLYKHRYYCTTSDHLVHQWEEWVNLGGDYIE